MDNHHIWGPPILRHIHLSAVHRVVVWFDVFVSLASFLWNPPSFKGKGEIRFGLGYNQFAEPHRLPLRSKYVCAGLVGSHSR